MTLAAAIAPAASGPAAGGFTKPMSHDAVFFPTTKAYLRPGDMMRATVIRNDRNVAMSTGNEKWQTRIQWLNAAQMPGLRKALTFSALADIKALIKEVPADVGVIEYNMERGMTPESDFANIAQTVEEFSKVVRANGRKFAFGPIRNTWDVLEKEGSLEKVTRACDGVAVQLQRVMQSKGNDPAAIVEEARALHAKFKHANPKVEVSMQLWIGRQTAEQMVAGFRAIEPYVDNAVIGTHNNPEAAAQVLKTLRGK